MSDNAHNLPPPEDRQNKGSAGEAPPEGSLDKPRSRRVKPSHLRIKGLFDDLDKEVTDPWSAPSPTEIQNAQEEAPLASPVPEDQSADKPGDEIGISSAAMSPSSTNISPSSADTPTSPDEPPIPAPEFFTGITPSRTVAPIQRDNRPSLGYTKTIGFRSSSTRPGDTQPGDDQISPADSALTSAGEDSLNQQQTVLQDAQSDQPAVLAFPLPLSSPAGIDDGQNVTLLLEFIDESSQRHWSEDELLLVEQVTDQLTLALENARLLEETQIRAEELTVLNEMSRTLSAQLSIQAILETIYRYTIRLIDAPNFYIAFHDAEKNEIRFPLVVEENQRLRWQSRPFGNGLTEHIIRTQQPLLIKENVLEWLQSQLGLEVQGQEAQSWLGVPLVYGDQVYGVIAAQSYTEPNHYNENHRDLLSAIANQAAVAIQHADLYTQEQQRRQIADSLSDIARAVSSALDIHTASERMLDELTKLIDFNSATIQVIQDGKRETVGRRAFGNDGQPTPNLQRPIEEDTLISRVIEERSPLLLSDTHGDPRWEILPETEHIRCWIAVPLLVGQQVIGLLIIDHTQPQAFDQTNIELLSAVAAQVSVAVQTARLFEETQNARDALEISERYQTSVAQSVAALTESGLSALPQVLEILGEAAQASRAFYLETNIDSRGPHWRLVTEWCAEDVAPQINNPNLKRLSLRYLQAWVERLSAEGSIAARLSDLPPEEQIFLEKLGTLSILQFVVPGAHDLPGCIGFEQIDYEREWGIDEIAALETAASALANTIARENLFDQVQVNLAETEALYQASARMNSAANYDEILNVLRQYTILGHGQLSNVTINLFDRPWTFAHKPEWMIPVTRWAALPSAETSAERFQLTSWSHAEKLLKPEKPIVVTDVWNDPRLSEGSRTLYIEQLKAKSLVFAPLNVAGRWIGHVIGVFSYQIDFPEKETRRLMSLAGQAAVAIQNLQSIELAEQRAQEAQQRSEDLAFINRVVATVASSLDLQASLSAIANEIGRTLNVQTSAALFNEERQSLTVMAGYSPLLDAPSVIGLDIALKDNPSSQQVIRTRKTLLIEDPKTNPLTEMNGGIIDLRKIEAMMIIPIMSANRVVGTFSVDIIQPDRSFTSEEINLAETTVIQAATALDNARLFRQTQQALSETELLYNASSELNAAQSFDDILNTLRRYSILGNVDYCISLDIFDHPWVGSDIPTGASVAAQWDNLPDHLSGRNREKDYKLRELPIIRSLLRPDAIIFIEDIEKDLRLDEFTRRLYRDNYSAQSTVFIPLVVGGLWIGFINAIYGTKAQLQEEEIRRLEVQAGQAAVAVQNLRQFEQIQSRAQYEYLTREIGTQVSSTIDRDTILMTTARSLGQALKASHIIIDLSAKEDQSEDSWSDLPTATYTYNHNEDRFLSDHEVQELNLKEVSPGNMYSPIILRGDLIGTIQVFDAAKSHEWTDDDKALLNTVSSQTALSLENARLFQETQTSLTETETLYQAGAELNAAQSNDDILDTLRKYSVLGSADKLINITLFNRPWIGDEKPEWNTPIVHWTTLPQENLKSRYSLDELPAFELLSPREPLLVKNIAKDSRIDPEIRRLYMEDFQALSTIMAPLVVAGQWIGTISGIYGIPVEFEEGEVRRLMALAGQAAVVIQNLQSLDLAERRAREAQRRLQDQTALREAGAVFSSTLDQQAVLDHLAEQVVLALDLTSAYISSYDPDTAKVQVIAEYKSSEAAPEETVSDLGVIYYEEFRSFETLIKDGYEIYHADDPNTPEENRQHMLEYRAKTSLDIPLQVEGRVIGYAELWESRQRRDFTQDEINLGQSIAMQAAVALENARLFERTQQVLSETEALYQAGAKLNAAQSNDDILDTLRKYTVLGAADKLIHITLFNRPWIGEDKPEWNTPIAHWTTLPPENLKSRYSLDELPASELLSPQEPLLIKNIAKDSRIDPETRRRYTEDFQALSTIMAPLVVAGQWIGTISGIYGIPVEFEEGEVRRLMALAGQAAVVIQNLQSLDLAERRAQEAQRRLQDQTTLREAGAVFSSTLDQQVVLNHLAEQMARALDLTSTYISSYDRDSGKATMVAEFISPNAAPEEIVSDLGVIYDEEYLEFEQLIKDGYEIYQLDDPNIPEDDRQHMEEYGAKTSMLIPLQVEGRFIGYVELWESRQRRDFTQDEINLGQSIALQAAVALENARLFERTQEVLAETEALYQASAEFNLSQSYDEILGILARHTLVGNNSYHATINQFDQPWIGDEMPEWVLTIARQGSLPQDVLSERYPLRSFPSARQLLKPDSITVIEDVKDDASLDDNARRLYAELFKAGATVFAPLVAGGQWIGFVNAMYPDRSSFSEDELRRLTILASQAAIAIQNIRLIEETRRKAGQLETAAEIARDTTSTLALDTLLARSVVLLCERFGYYHASIFLLDDEDVNAVVRESTGEAGKVMKANAHSLPVGGRSVIGQTTLTGEAVVLNDITQEDAQVIHHHNPLLPLTRGELGIPLKIGDRVIGALDVQSTQTEAFSADDIAVLQILSDQIAVAVDNARAYEISQTAVEDIREADRLKSQFLANMSHELRTPLNSIIGFSRVIHKGIDGPVNELQQQDLAAIYNSGQHLLGLINDVLDLSKIEAGKMELSFEENTDLVDILKGVMSTTVGLVRDKPVVLKQEYDPDLPLLSIDPMKIRQVLLNLLSNAAKFTEEGSITLQACVQQVDDELSEVIVRVIDSGYGIAPEDQIRLFQPFSQVDGSLTRKTGGTGLGLSICHHLIRLHGGRIGLESEVGKGSTFYFTLPIDFKPLDKQELDGVEELSALELPDVDKAIRNARNTDSKRLKAAAEARKSDLAAIKRPHENPTSDLSTADSGQNAPVKQGTLAVSGAGVPPAIVFVSGEPATEPASETGSGVILTIEQDHMVTDLYRRYLANHNYTVIALTELDQAITVARGIQPLVITLDVAMEAKMAVPASEQNSGITGPDGWKILETLKSDPTTQHIPVIVCSLLDERDKALEIGASNYLLKPILEADLMNAINTLVGDKR